MREPMVVRRNPRLFAGVMIFALSGALGGCGSMPSWDPTDMLDFLDTEKRTPGERKPVFPEGVPGISQGVPKEMIRGSAESRATDEAQAAAAAAAAQPAPPVQAQSAPPPARPSRTAARRPPAPAPAPVEIAPDDVNVDVPPPPRGQTQWPQPAAQPQAQPQVNPFPAPLPR